MTSKQVDQNKVVDLDAEREKRTPKVDPLDYPWEGTLPLSQKMLNAIKDIEDENEVG
jgi:hypothetical protein